MVTRHERSSARLEVEVADRQEVLKVRAEVLQRAAAITLEGEGIERAAVSIVVVDDPSIEQLNRRYLNHDYATDVLSFRLDDDHRPLEAEQRVLEGEVIVSAEMAQRRCGEFGWSAECELVWYVVHGVLHLCGWNDQTGEQRDQMERRQQHYLQRLREVSELKLGCRTESQAEE